MYEPCARAREEMVSSYIRTRDEYFNNSERLSGKGEFRKASELLWGAITQAIKALAAASGRRISQHRHFFDVMRRLTAEMGEPTLYESFLFLRQLHTNFYDETISPEDFQIYRRRALSFLTRLDEIMRSLPPI